MQGTITFRVDRAKVRAWIKRTDLLSALLVLALLSLGLGWPYQAPAGAIFFTAALLVGTLTVRRRLEHPLKDSRKGIAVTLSHGGIDVASWGIGEVAWSEIDSISPGPGAWVLFHLHEPERGLKRASPLQAFFMRSFGWFTRGPFAVDCGLLESSPQGLITAGRDRLEKSRSL